MIARLSLERQRSFPKVFKTYYPWYDFNNYKKKTPELVAGKVSSSAPGSVGYIFMGLDTPISEVLKLRDALPEDVVLISPTELCKI